MSATHEYGLRFWVGVGVGSLLMAWGVFLFVEATSEPDDRVGLLVVVVGADLIHDALIAPFLCLVGTVVARAAPPWLRAPVQAALIASAAVLVVVWLPLQGSADPVGNTSIQPLQYPNAALTVLAVVWVAALGWALVRRRA